MVELSELPDLLAEIAEVAGLSAALAIAQLRGGTKVHFPAEVDDDHWLPVAIGREAADKLCEHFRVNHKGGVSVTMPLGPTRMYEVARMRAAAMRDAGSTIRETALALGVSTRAVEKWGANRRHAAERASRRAAVMRPARAVVSAQVAAAGTVVNCRELLVMVAEVAGMPVALALAVAKRGLTVSFPFPAAEGHWLVQAFGHEVADRLGAHFGQTHGPEVAFVVPPVPPFLRDFVQRRALVMRDEGHSAEEVARSLCVTPAQVEKWCAVARTAAAMRAAEASSAALIEEEG